MRLTVSGFDWDAGNKDKCRKHGVGLLEIEEAFENVIAVAVDERHSSVGEQRHVAVGRTDLGRYIFVVFTERSRRGVTLIRPISARYMHRKEVAQYEKEARRSEKISDLQE